jgi:IS30 family transposase
MTRRRATEDDKDDMRRLRAKGLSLTAIGARLGWSKSEVHRAVKDMEVDSRITANRARSTSARWIKRAQKMRRAGLNRREIAAALGVTTSSVYRLID